MALIDDVAAFFHWVAFISAFLILIFAVSQATLAVLYGRSKKADVTAAPTSLRKAKLPRVLIQLPIYNEKFVVERLLRTVAKIDYPKNLLTIQLLDDSGDETSAIAARTIAEITRNGGPKIQHIKRTSREGFKAGALSYGLKMDKSDFVAIFDADFLPRPGFLHDLLPYFSDPKVGLVQTRWDYVNRDYSLLTRLMAFAIDNHFSVEQGGRQRLGCFTNFNGTAGMWRRKAIDDAGGWSADCLTEDLDLSFRSQMKGWKFLFVEGLSTPSELPVTMQSIRDQQTRWTKGAAETSRKNLVQLWLSQQPMLRKVIGSFHMLNSSVFLPFLLLGIACATFPFLPGTVPSQVLLSVYGMMTLATGLIFFTYWVSRRYGGFDWLNSSPVEILRTTLLFMLMTAGFSLNNGWAAMQGLSGRQTAFARTPKFNVNNQSRKKLRPAYMQGPRLPAQFFLECLLLAYFGAALALSFWQGRPVFVVIVAFFFAGYMLTIFFTLRDRTN